MATYFFFGEFILNFMYKLVLANTVNEINVLLNKTKRCDLHKKETKLNIFIIFNYRNQKRYEIVDSIRFEFIKNHKHNWKKNLMPLMKCCSTCNELLMLCDISKIVIVSQQILKYSHGKYRKKTQLIFKSSSFPAQINNRRTRICRNIYNFFFNFWF